MDGEWKDGAIWNGDVNNAIPETDGGVYVGTFVEGTYAKGKM